MKSDRFNRGPLSTADFSLTGDELRAFVRGGVDSVASMVETTYGPQGLDTLIELDGSKNEVEVVVSSSGSAVLDAVQRGGGFSHPVAAVLVDAVDTMHRDLHDGSTATLVMTRALVDRGYELLDQGLTPTDIHVGYAIAAEEIGKTFDDLARPVSHTDTELLQQVARTTIVPRLGGEANEDYVRLVVEAVQGLAVGSDGAWIDTNQVKIVSDPGAETALHEGVIVTRWPRGAEASDSDRSLVDFDWTPQFPEPREDVTVAIIDSEIDLEDSGTNFGHDDYSGVHLDSAEAVQRYHSGLEARRREMVGRLADLGVDIFGSQVRIADDLIRLFEEAGIEVVDKIETPKADIDRLATATGATVVSNPADVTADNLGTAGRVYDHRATDEKWTHFTECGGGAYTMTIRAPTDHGAKHHVDVVEDALDVTATAVMDGQVLPGAGALQTTAAAALREASYTVGGREALAVSAFGAALEDAVRTLATNGGLDPIDTIAGLRTAHAGEGGDAIGIDVRTGEQVNAWEAGIVEPRRVFSQALETGRTMASQFLSTDAFLHPNTALGEFKPDTEHR